VSEHAPNNRENTASGRSGGLFGLPEDDREAVQGDGYKGGAFKGFLAAQNKVNEQNLVSDQWLTTLFRRTANALHPDKERNEDLRSEKQELMAQLLAAREQKDVFSLLNMYMQYVDGNDLFVTDETMGKLCAQLNEQKHQLADEKQYILHQHPEVAELYKKLHCRSKKKRDKNIERHIQDIQQSTQQMLEFVVSLRNLEILKMHLADRYQEHCDKECG
jgi:hypothetical protein